jgi:spore germination protein KC
MGREEAGKNMEYIFIKSAVLFLLLLPLTGCWNNRPLKSIGLCAAVGIDRPAPEKIEFSIQIVQPAVLGSGEQMPSSQNATLYMSNTSDTLHSAGRNIFNINLARTIFIDHVQLIIIGEEMARKGIADALDFWERDHEANINALVIVAKGVKASVVLTKPSQQDPVPALQIVKLLNNNILTARSQNVNLLTVLSRLNTDGYELSTGALRFRPGTGRKSLYDIDMGGAAVFKGDKLIGWLNPEETTSLLMVEGTAKGGLFEVPNPFQQGKTIGLEMMGAKTAVKLNIKNGKPIFQVQVKTRMRLAEFHGTKPAIDLAAVKKIQTAGSKRIKTLIKKTLHRAQRVYKSDIFGFGLKIKRKDPVYWDQIKNNWDQDFQSLPVDVKVSVVIDEIGRIYDRIYQREDKK